jgi:dihydrolipoamide dehydrogenase
LYSFKSIVGIFTNYSEVAHFADHGIEVSGEVKVNLEKMIARKQAIVDQTSGGVKYLMDKNKVTVLKVWVLLLTLLMLLVAKPTDF